MVAGAGNNIYLFNKSSSIPMWSNNTGSAVNSVDISSDGSYIVAGSTNNKTYLFHKFSSTPLWNYSLINNAKHVAISADGNYVVAASGQKVYFFNSTKPLNPYLWNCSVSDSVTSLAISYNGGNFVVGTYDNNTYYFNSTSPTPEWSYLTQNSIKSVAISPNGYNIAVGGGIDLGIFRRGRIYLINLEFHQSGNFQPIILQCRFRSLPMANIFQQ